MTNSLQTRRSFIKKSAALSGLLVGNTYLNKAMASEPLFKISLAEWSLNRSIFAGKIDHLDFAILARQHGIEGVEYVNQFFMDKAEDTAYLREMKKRADGEGVRSILIMCDREGDLGHEEEAKRIEAVENHHKWVHAARYLGCHMIRVNGYTSLKGNLKDIYEEEQKLVADGLHRLCEYADQYDINVTIENHGRNSSSGKWLAGVIQQADHPRAGTLPDFGNFRMSDEASYDSYRGVEELMPYATGVSVKPRVWDDKLNESDLDYTRMMKIVLDAGYRGYCGIEYGPEGREWEGIMEVKAQLEKSREALMDSYSE